MGKQGNAHQEPPESNDGGKQYFRRIHLVCDGTERDDGLGGGGLFAPPANELVPTKPTVPTRTPGKLKNKPEGLHISTSQLPAFDPRAQVKSWKTWQRRLFIYHYFTIVLICFFFGSFSGSQHGPYTSVCRTHFACTGS